MVYYDPSGSQFKYLSMLRVLIACEFSGVVREAFRAQGADAVSVDLLASELPGPHIVGDVREHLRAGWDMLIGFPPCTYLCNSGVRWLTGEQGGATGPRYRAMKEAIRLYLDLWNAPIKRICIENPRMHYFAAQELGKPTQIIQPWMFGHGDKKGTWLKLRNLPQLEATKVVNGRNEKIHGDWWKHEGIRWKERSRTYPGVAAAMAEQWSRLS